MNMKTEFLTPVGRIVQGDPMEAQTKNMQGQPLMTQSGQPTQRYFCALAFPKLVNGQPNPEFNELWAKLSQVAAAGFPALQSQGALLPPWDPRCRFSWKVMDGDGIDDNNKPNANKEGFAGHWVVKFSSSFAPRCFHAGHYAPHEQITDPKAIQRGYYARVAGTIEPNGNAQKPGLYVNLSMVELVIARPDLVITSGPDAGAVFGAAPAAAPAGLPPAPAAGAAPGLPPMPGAPAAYAPPAPAAYAPPPAPAPYAPPVAPPAPMAVAPNPGFTQGPAAGLPPMPGAPAPYAPPAPSAAPPSPPAPAGLPGSYASPAMTSPTSRPMTAAAQGRTYEQYLQAGWSEAQMRTAGLLA